jgi:hypothetical protein
MSSSILVSTFPSSALPAREDLKAAAKRFATPKVMRFLDGMALPAYVAGMSALAECRGIDPLTCGVMTVTNWDPTYHQPELPEDGPAGFQGVATYYRQQASPTGWLRKMMNNTNCHVCVSAKLQGPNLHFAGWSPALVDALFLADRLLETGAAEHMLVLAFDAPPGEESTHDPAGTASAIVLARTAAGSGTFEVPTLDAGRPDVGSVAMLDGLIAAAGPVREVAPSVA